MRAVVMDEFGGPEVLRIREVADPVPGPGQVLVEVEPGEWVLVEAAGGGLGSLLVQLAVASGARVVGAARGAAKGELVASSGAEHYVEYSRPGWEREVVELTGGVDLVFDGVGGELGAQGLRVVRDGGRASVYGMAGVSWTEPGDRVRLVEDGAPPTPAEAAALTAEALAHAAAGRLRATIGQTFSLPDAAAAHRAIEARATTGKTLLIP